jgi:hypothetical protein
VSLSTPSSSRTPDHDPHRTIYYLGYPLGRFAGLKHRQLACQVGVIITTRRIRRTLVNKINLLVDSSISIEASLLAPIKAESIFLRRASGCFGTSRGTSRGSMFTTSPTPHVRVPQHVTRLAVDYFAYAARSGASARHAARRAARHAARRGLFRIRRVTRHRLLHLHRASGCFGTSRGLSRDSSSTTSPRAGSSSTTSPTPRVRVPRHVAWLVMWLAVDYFTYAAHPVASAHRAARRRLPRIRRAARHVARRRLLRLRRASGCFGTSRVRHRLLHLRRASGCFGTSRGLSHDSSSTTSPTPHVRVPRLFTRLVTPFVAPLVID